MIVTDSPLNYSLHKRYNMYNYGATCKKGGDYCLITHDVGARIRFLRIQMGLSQEKLALKAEIDRTYLAGIELGKRNATLVSIEKIVNALEISMKNFWDFSPYC